MGSETLPIATFIAFVLSPRLANSSDAILMPEGFLLLKCSDTCEFGIVFPLYF
jgi:hypothetical protein